jgi:pyruvate, water dikinase
VSPFVVSLLAPAARDPARFGAKAANQAALAAAGLPTAGGFCLDAAAYRAQTEALGLAETARLVFATEGPEARRHALTMRLGIMEGAIAPEIREPLLTAWGEIVSAAGVRGVVRSSALCEDRFGSSFAGQFESYLGLVCEADFLTAVRASWASLWSNRALRYMASRDLDPAESAMAIIIQPLVEARFSGGGLSRTAEGGMILSAAPGLGPAIAQGEVVPDHLDLAPDGRLVRNEPGRAQHREGCARGHRMRGAARERDAAATPCLDREEAEALGRLLRRVEAAIGEPVEIEWAMDDTGFKLIQARPLLVASRAQAPDQLWLQHPRLLGQPAGIGWSEGRACVVHCECELGRLAPGDILVTRVAGPALAQVLPLVGGVVAELGGSTSHLASLGRERGIPMVLGVLNATRRIPDGSTVAVDGVVRWMR